MNRSRTFKTVAPDVVDILLLDPQQVVRHVSGLPTIEAIGHIDGLLRDSLMQLDSYVLRDSTPGEIVLKVQRALAGIVDRWLGAQPEIRSAAGEPAFQDVDLRRWPVLQELRRRASIQRDEEVELAAG